MEKTLLAVSFFAVLLVIAACGGGNKKNETPAKISTEMQDFMSKLDGKPASVSAALTQFGKPDLDNKEMDLYGLADPKVLETNGNCYLLQCSASNNTIRMYNICWEGGKISSIEKKGKIE